MGREEDRKRFANRHLHASIDRSLHGTVSPPMDRFGVRLKLGDLVLYTPTYPTLFQVSEIVPVLDPTAPAGTVQLVLSGVMPLVLNPNQPCISVVHVESPEGAEQAIKRHHAGRAVSGGNGRGPDPSGIGIEVVREDDREDDSDGPGVTVTVTGADAEGGGSIHREGDAESDCPGDSTGDRQGDSTGDSTGPGISGGVGSAASGVGASDHASDRTSAKVDKDHE